MSEFERKVARIKRAAQRYALAKVKASWPELDQVPQTAWAARENELAAARRRLDKVIRECV